MNPSTISGRVGHRALLWSAVVLWMSSANSFAQFGRGKSFVVETADVQSVTAQISLNIHCDQIEAEEWILIHPVIPEHPSQIKPTTAMTPVATPTVERGPFPRPMLRVRVPVTDALGKHDVAVEITMKATLRSRQLTPAPAGRKLAKVEELTSDDRVLYLNDRKVIDFNNPDFGKWMAKQKLTRKKNESELDYAYRAFNTIRTGFGYEFEEKMDRKAFSVCKAGKSDCGGLSHLFVAMMRANKIPARCLYGRWAKSSRPDEQLGGFPYFMTHVKAEFFADGIGWIPVDPASAVQFDKSDDGLKYFGADPGDFITFHIEPGFDVDSIYFGKESLPVLQGARYWVKGQGKMDNAEIKRSWTVTGDNGKL